MEWIAAAAVQLAVGVLTLSISVELRCEHAQAALRDRRALAIGLVAQLLAMPALVLALGGWLPGGAVLTALCLIAMAPSGPTSNYLAHVARGDVAYAMVLTIVGTLLSAVAIPLALPALLRAMTGDSVDIPTPATLFVGLFWMVLLPLGAGLAFSHRHPAAAQRWRPALARTAAVLFVLLVVAAIASQWRLLLTAATGAGLAVLGVNLAALALGALAGALAGLAQAQRRTLALKIGIQNVSIAVGIAMGVMQRIDIAAIAALYGVTQLLVGAAFALGVRRLGP